MTTLARTKPYLTKKINTWYAKYGTKHGITGHVTNIHTYSYNKEPAHLIIEYTENRDGGHPIYDIPNTCDIPCYTSLSLPQLLSCWMDDSEWSAQLRHSTTHVL